MVENPVQQIVLWAIDLAYQAVGGNWGALVTVLALPTAAYLAWTIWTEWRTDDTPSIGYTSATGVGSTTVSISGTHVSLLLAGAIGLLLWPMPLTQPEIGMLLVGAVVAHVALEKREEVSA